MLNDAQKMSEPKEEPEMTAEELESLLHELLGY